MAALNYTPPATIREFIRHFSPGELFFDWIIGPVGCLPADSEFLTPTGWKRMDAYTLGDEVAVWSPDTKQVMFEPAPHVDLPAQEAFYRFDSGSLEMELSPEHTVAYYDYRGEFQVATALDCALHPSRRTIPTTFTLDRQDNSSFTDSQLRLLMAVSADGSLPKAGQQCVVAVRKERKKARLRELLCAGGVVWEERTYEPRPTETVFVFNRAGLTKSLSFVWTLSTRQLEIVLDECLRWDGLNNHAEKRYYTTVAEHADAIQFAAHACGYRASIHAVDDPRNAAWATMYTVHIRASDNAKNKACVRAETRVTRVASLDRRKYCFTTSTGFFVARCGKSVFITGNSGKTTGIFFKLAYMASLQDKSPRDGIRRSRAVIVRNTMPQLRDTTITSWNYWFKEGQAGIWRATDNKFILKFGDVECEVMFRPLDTPDDVARVLSLEVTFAILDEFVQIDKAIVDALAARCGRFPPQIDGGATNWGMWGSSNPGNEDDWWYDHLFEHKPKNATYFEQPSGFSPEAENVENLPGKEKYYTSLAEGKAEHWVKQFIEVQWGYSLDGKPVVPTFNQHIHIAQKPLVPNPRLPLVVGFDPGVSSALIFGQMDLDGRLVVFDELVQQDYGAERMCSERLKPLLRNRYPDLEIIIAPDPASNHRAQSDERSVVDVLRKHKFTVKFPDMNNQLQPRLDAVEYFTTRLTAAGPALLIAPHCKNLIRALTSGWRYSVDKKNKRSPEPEKNQYSHPADAFTYLCRYFHVEGARNARRQAVGFRPPQFTNPYVVG